MLRKALDIYLQHMPLVHFVQHTTLFHTLSALNGRIQARQWAKGHFLPVELVEPYGHTSHVHQELFPRMHTK